MLKMPDYRRLRLLLDNEKAFNLLIYKAYLRCQISLSLLFDNEIRPLAIRFYQLPYPPAHFMLAEILLLNLFRIKEKHICH